MLIVGEKALKLFLEELSDELAHLGAEIYLFGSVASNSHQPDSDVDLLIIIDEGHHEAIRNQINDFLLETGILVSPIFISPKQFKMVKHLTFYRHILKEGIKLG